MRVDRRVARARLRAAVRAGDGPNGEHGNVVGIGDRTIVLRMEDSTRDGNPLLARMVVHSWPQVVVEDIQRVRTREHIGHVDAVRSRQGAIR